MHAKLGKPGWRLRSLRKRLEHEQSDERECHHREQGDGVRAGHRRWQTGLDPAVDSQVTHRIDAAQPRDRPENWQQSSRSDCYLIFVNQLNLKNFFVIRIIYVNIFI